jgi:CubicO group peptidase (beta-lactamase class C family)
MKQLILLSSSLLLISAVVVNNNNNYHAAVNKPASEYDQLFQSIKYKLEGKCVGYQITISHNGQNPVSFAGGYARLPQDIPELKMNGNVKFHTASVSKTITAIALYRVLQSINRDVSKVFLKPVFYYVPRHWTIHESMKRISVWQLLSHTSGIKKNFGVDYAGLKELFETGINLEDWRKYDYNNANFGIMRFIIPGLLEKNITSFYNTKGGLAAETLQAIEFANFYKEYVQDSVFTPAGVSNAGFAIPPFIGGVCYRFPHMGYKGETFSDAFLTAGSHGWVLSSQELDKVMSAFYYTEKIVSKETREIMIDRKYGFDGWGKTAKGYKYLSKGGYYPGTQNKGELHTWVLHFEEGYDMSVIINSPYTKTEGEIFFETAFDEWYKPIIKKVIPGLINNR